MTYKHSTIACVSRVTSHTDFLTSCLSSNSIRLIRVGMREIITRIRNASLQCCELTRRLARCALISCLVILPVDVITLIACHNILSERYTLNRTWCCMSNRNISALYIRTLYARELSVGLTRGRTCVRVLIFEYSRLVLRVIFSPKWSRYSERDCFVCESIM